MASSQMATLIARRFIQRKSAKARQTNDGTEYRPVADWDNGKRTKLYPFMMQDLKDHVEGRASYGHYLLDENDMTKLFAFDIDLEKNSADFTGSWVEIPDLSKSNYMIPNAEYDRLLKVHECNPREAWRDRSHPARPWLKYQLRHIADRLCREISEVLEIPTVAAYSGHKGIHVYGFTGPVPAGEAREAAEIILDSIGDFAPHRGVNFFKTKNQDPYTGFPNITVEVFPKQESLSGRDLGNLMRLPLGRNMRSNDPTFFIDMRAPAAILAPHPNPIALLESGNPWRD